MQELAQLSAYANAVGSASAVAILCRLLVEQGLLTGAQVEMLRQAALLGYDKLREQGMSEEHTKQLEEVRKIADGMWQRVALAAEKPGPHQTSPQSPSDPQD